METATGPGDLTALDWIAAVLTALGGLFCASFPFLAAPAFAEMFADFGGPLPAITRLGLTLWFPLVLAAIPFTVLAVALLRRVTLGRRRALIVASFVLTVAASGLCLYSMYAPIFALAGTIR